MARELRWLNLGAGGNPETFTATELPGGPGQNGGLYLDGINRYQSAQIVDASAVAGDLTYWKSYTSSYQATMTIGNASAHEPAGVVTTTVAANSYCLLKQGGTVSLKASGVFARGTPVWPDSGNNRAIPAGVFSGSLTAATTTAVGGVVQVANPCTGAWLVTSFIQNRTTKSTGAATMDLGVAVDATTASDNLLDGINMNAAEANGENNFQNGGTNGKAAVYGAAGSYINGTASATVAGLVGTYSGTFRPVGFNSLPVIGVAQGTISGGKVSTFLRIEPV